MTQRKPIFPLLLFIILTVSGCKSEPEFRFSDQGRFVPEFSSDRAFSYIEAQVNFGPRVPGSTAHREAIQYFNRHFRETAGNNSVYIQAFEMVVYGDTLSLYNLIASFAPDKDDRILLAAHWDSRPRGEEDPDHPHLPIPGADDGASGVGVLMEFAAIFAEHEPPVGVDIILFDGEDYGKEGDLEHYFLGSRHWGNHPPVPGYNPRFGILLDMVGGQHATFPKEGYSMRFAPRLVDEIWSIGHEFGHSDLFLNERGGMIADDHIIVEQLTGIPMINIIHHRIGPDGQVRFPPYWHTQKDNLDIIDKDVLQAVGDVLLELIYNRIPT